LSYTRRAFPGTKKPPGPRFEVGGVGADAAALPAPPLQVTIGFVTSESRLHRHDVDGNPIRRRPRLGDHAIGLLRHDGSTPLEQSVRFAVIQDGRRPPFSSTLL